MKSVLPNHGVIRITDAPRIIRAKDLCFPLGCRDDALRLTVELYPRGTTETEFSRVLLERGNTEPFLLLISASDHVKIFVR